MPRSRPWSAPHAHAHASPSTHIYHLQASSTRSHSTQFVIASTNPARITCRKPVYLAPVLHALRARILQSPGHSNCNDLPTSVQEKATSCMACPGAVHTDFPILVLYVQATYGSAYQQKGGKTVQPNTPVVRMLPGAGAGGHHSGAEINVHHLKWICKGLASKQSRERHCTLVYEFVDDLVRRESRGCAAERQVWSSITIRAGVSFICKIAAHKCLQVDSFCLRGWMGAGLLFLRSCLKHTCSI